MNPNRIQKIKTMPNPVVLFLGEDLNKAVQEQELKIV